MNAFGLFPDVGLGSAEVVFIDRESVIARDDSSTPSGRFMSDETIVECASSREGRLTLRH